MERPWGALPQAGCSYPVLRKLCENDVCLSVSKKGVKAEVGANRKMKDLPFNFRAHFLLSFT